MNKEQIWYGVGGLVLGILLVNLIMPGTWRGNMMYGQGGYDQNNGTAQCGPTGCSLQGPATGMMGAQNGTMQQGMMGQGMMSGSSAMGSGATMMNATDTDKAFLEEMTPHHQAAIQMATMMKAKTNRPEMKKMADDIISAQTREMQMMQDWYESWYGGQ